MSQGFPCFIARLGEIFPGRQGELSVLRLFNRSKPSFLVRKGLSDNELHERSRSFRAIGTRAASICSSQERQRRCGFMPLGGCFPEVRTKEC